MELRTHESIRDIGEETWGRLAANAPPFVSFAFLDALEVTGCVRPERGWMPLHVTLEEGGYRNPPCPHLAAPTKPGRNRRVVYQFGRSEGIRL